MTFWRGHALWLIGILWVESDFHRWIFFHKGQWCLALTYSQLLSWTSCWTNIHVWCDFIRHRDSAVFNLYINVTACYWSLQARSLEFHWSCSFSSNGLRDTIMKPSVTQIVISYLIIKITFNLVQHIAFRKDPLLHPACLVQQTWCVLI